MTITTSPFEKALIEGQIAAIGARRLLEIGSFKGETTAIMSRAVAEFDGYVVAIDPMKWASKAANLWEWFDGLFHPFSYERHFWRNVRRHGHDNVHLMRGLSTDPHILESPDPRLAEFDLVFIDGEHVYETVIADFQNWGSRVRPGGRVLLHDCVARFPGVIRAIRELDADPRYRVHWPDEGTIAVVDVLAEAAVPRVAVHG